MISFGTMINAARLEMAREPMVWWTLLSAFGFMFILVLSANLFADAVQKALDPRVKTRTLNNASAQKNNPAPIPASASIPSPANKSI